MILFLVFILINFEKEIIEWGNDIKRKSQAKQESRALMLKDDIKVINRSENAPDFDSVYYYKRVGSHKDVQNLKEQFKEDFKENFRNYEKKKRKVDIFDIQSSYDFYTHKYKRSGVWIYQIRIVAILRVDYKRSFYYLGEGVYKKELGAMEFTLVPDGNRVGLGNGVWVSNQ